VITFEFPARGALPPLTLKWYDGGLMPPPPPELETSRQLPDNGTLFIGSKATALATLYNQSVRIIPETRMQELVPSLPPKTIPRIEGGHFAEWVRACKGVRRRLEFRGGLAPHRTVPAQQCPPCAPAGRSMGRASDAGHEPAGSESVFDDSVSPRLRRVNGPPLI